MQRVTNTPKRPVYAALTELLAVLNNTLVYKTKHCMWCESDGDEDVLWLRSTLSPAWRCFCLESCLKKQVTFTQSNS